jgi:hypothetical protein
VTNDYDYKNYSLEKLSEFLQDALQTEAKPTEIHETIVKTLKKEIQYHDVCKRQAEDVLDLIGGHRDLSFMTSGLDEHPYGESFMSASDDAISFTSPDNDSDDVTKFPKRY